MSIFYIIGVIVVIVVVASFLGVAHLKIPRAKASLHPPASAFGPQRQIMFTESSR